MCKMNNDIRRRGGEIIKHTDADIKNAFQSEMRLFNYDITSCLTLRKSPNGEIIYGCGWQNGDSILVHGSYREGNWLFAYQNGKFGYVNGNYVC